MACLLKCRMASALDKDCPRCDTDWMGLHKCCLCDQMHHTASAECASTGTGFGSKAGNRILVTVYSNRAEQLMTAGSGCTRRCNRRDCEAQAGVRKTWVLIGADCTNSRILTGILLRVRATGNGCRHRRSQIGEVRTTAPSDCCTSSWVDSMAKRTDSFP